MALSGRHFMLTISFKLTIEKFDFCTTGFTGEFETSRIAWGFLFYEDRVGDWAYMTLQRAKLFYKDNHFCFS